MKTPQIKFTTYLLACLIAGFTMSCNKSTDLLSAYVVNKAPESHLVADLKATDNLGGATLGDEIIFDVYTKDGFINKNTTETIKVLESPEVVVVMSEE